MDQGFDDHINVDGRPADNEDGHHHEDHPGDSSEVPVLLLGARQHPDTLQAQNHESVAHSDD